MFFMRIGLGEMVLCGVLVLALIIIPLLLAWKTRRVNKEG
jgi:ABC-type phosphate transport system permease subunit